MMDLTLKLDEECWICDGTGEGGSEWKLMGDKPPLTPNPREPHGCKHCHGTGRTLTNTGQALIDFLRTHHQRILEEE